MNILNKILGESNKKQSFSWALYDFANSSYSLIVISFVFPIYFREVIAVGQRGDFYWGLVISISILLGGLIAPVMGAIADYDSHKKSRFILFALLTMVGTSLLYFTGSGMLFVASLLFIFTNLFFELSQVLYDSFVGQVSTPKTVGRISGFAWGLGYLGGILALVLLRPFFDGGYGGELLGQYKLTFPLTALFFFIFAIPAFVYLKSQTRRVVDEQLFRKIKIGVGQVINTIKNVRQYKNIAWFLLGFFLINDALVTLFAFTPIYGRTTLGLSFGELTFLLILLQIIAFPSATFFGWLSDKKGSKKILLSTIAIWAFIVVLLAAAQTKVIFYILVLLTGLVVGSSQAIARSWLSKLVPEEKRFEFFGFNGFASKVAATIGPVLFGTVSILTGSQRWAMLALLPFFIISFVIFSKIEDRQIR